jgi:hypothetical protein
MALVFTWASDPKLYLSSVMCTNSLRSDKLNSGVDFWPNGVDDECDFIIIIPERCDIIIFVGEYEEP